MTVRPLKSYMICATQRSGSNLLCEALADTGVAGRPTEFFLPEDHNALCQRWGVSTDVEFLDKVIESGSTPNGVFGVKIMMGEGYMGEGYFEHFIGTLTRVERPEGGDVSAPELVGATFPNLHYIWVTRRNKVRQAVSWWKAIQTDVWGRGRGERPLAKEEPEFNFEAIDSLTQALVLKEASWQEYFLESGSVPFVVVYEDFVEAYAETVAQILQFLGVPAPQDLTSNVARLQKQADELSEEWAQRYRELKQAGSEEIQWEYVAGRGLTRS